MTCTLITSQMEMSLMAINVSPGKTPVAGEGSPQCTDLHALPVLIWLVHVLFAFCGPLRGIQERKR